MRFLGQIIFGSPIRTWLVAVGLALGLYLLLTSARKLLRKRFVHLESAERLDWKDLAVNLLVSTRGFTLSERTKQFLDSIPAGGLQEMRAAAFDTRLLPEDVKNAIYTFFSGIFGFAAQKIARRLENKGAQLIPPPEGFAVTASEGPLKAGELERAAAWGRSLLDI